MVYLAALINTNHRSPIILASTKMPKAWKTTGRWWSAKHGTPAMQCLITKPRRVWQRRLPFFLSPPSGLGLLLNYMQGFRYASPPACGLSSFQDFLSLHKRKCVMLLRLNLQKNTNEGSLHLQWTFKQMQTNLRCFSVLQYTLDQNFHKAE